MLRTVSVAAGVLSGLFASSAFCAEQVTVHRDAWGVPHVFADDPACGAYGLGYAQAEDRLSDIYTAVRTGMGTMAEAFGPKFVEQDYMMRLCRNTQMAQKSWDGLPDHLKRIMTRFTAGINAWVAEHPDDVPEHAVKLEPWMPLTISRAMVLRWPLGAIMDDLNNRRSRPPMQSNEWAVAPSRSADGTAILLADPHLTWEGLAVMYEARVHAQELQMNGYFLIGTPLLGIGHSRYVGWALTTGGPDCGDAYEMTIHRGERPEYLYDGTWRPMDVEQFTIPVKGADPVVKTALYTHLGPVIRMAEDDDSLAWVGAAPLLNATKIMQQSWKMVTARNVYEFYDAIGMGEFNEQNVMFADVEGNIGYVRAGMTPIRPSGYDWTAPVPGHTSATAWKGIHHVDDLVHIINPPQGFMQNCNVTPEVMMPDSPLIRDRYLPHIFNAADWEKNNPRSIRARQLLDGDTSITREEAIAMALDVHDIQAERWQNELRSMVESAGTEKMKDAEFAAVVEAILSWDGQFTPEATATCVYKFWRLKCGNALDVSPLAHGGHLSRPDQAAALDLLQATIAELKQKYGRWDVPWGDVHRVGREGRFFPVGGAEFRSGSKEANFSETLFDVRCDPDPEIPGQYTARNGTMALILMFFREDGIESLTCTPWGQSGHPDSPHFLDQGEKLYSRRGLKPTWWNPDDLKPHIRTSSVLTVVP